MFTLQRMKYSFAILHNRGLILRRLPFNFCSLSSTLIHFQFLMFLNYLSLLVSVTSISIPIRFGPDNQPFIPDALSLIPVGTHPYIRGSDLSQVKLVFEEFSTVRPSPVGDDYIDLSALDMDPFVRYLCQSDMIGIGHKSDVLEEYRTISILRSGPSQNGLLILNDTNGENFDRSCLVGSIARIPRNTELVQYSLIWPSDEANAIGEQAFTDSPTHLSSSSIVELPPSMVFELYLIILRGQEPFRALNVVDNCNYELQMSRAPKISLTFTQSGTRVILFPQDYIVFKSDTNQCVLKFSRASHDSRINPLAIPGVNVHITQNDVYICDAIL